MRKRYYWARGYSDEAIAATRYYSDEARAAIQAVGKTECDWNEIWMELEDTARAYDFNTTSREPAPNLALIRKNMKEFLAASEPMLRTLSNEEMWGCNLVTNSANELRHYLIQGGPSKVIARMKKDILYLCGVARELDRLTDSRSRRLDDAERDLRESVEAIGLRLFGRVGGDNSRMVKFMKLALRPLIGKPSNAALRVTAGRHKRKRVNTPR